MVFKQLASFEGDWSGNKRGVLKIWGNSAHSSSLVDLQLRYWVVGRNNVGFPADDNASIMWNQGLDGDQVTDVWWNAIPANRSRQIYATDYYNQFRKPWYHRVRFDDLGMPYWERGGTHYRQLRWNVKITKPSAHTWSGLISLSSVVSVAPKKRPTSVAAKLSGTDITVSWGRPVAYHRTRVERQINGGAWVRVLNTTEAVRSFKESQSRGRSYRYRVAGLNAAGKQTAWVYTATVGIALIAAGKPVVARNSDTSHTVSSTWSGTATRSVWQRKLWDVAATNVGTVSGNGKSFTDLTTRANQRFQYRVQLHSAGGASAWSPWSNAVATTPAAPTNVKGTRVGNNVRVSASLPAHATSFNVRDNGASIASNVAMPYTHVSPNQAVTHQYGVQARVSSGTSNNSVLTSAWSANSAVIALPGKPNAPTNLSPNGRVLGVGSRRLEWQHNPVDASEQTAYTLRYRVNGGSWTTVTGTTAEFRDVIFSAGVVEWQVFTKGIFATASDYSAVASFEVIDVPVVTITSPDEPVVSYADLTVVWDYSQAQSKVQDSWVAELEASGELIEVLTGSGAATTASFATRLLGDTEYLVRVTVTSNGLTATDETVFSTFFLPPIQGEIDGVWLEETGAVQLETVLPDAASMDSVNRFVDPSFETVGPSQVVATNTFPNPSFKTPDVFTVAGTNLVKNPAPTSADTWGWEAFGSAIDGVDPVRGLYMTSKSIHGSFSTLTIGSREASYFDATKSIKVNPGEWYYIELKSSITSGNIAGHIVAVGLDSLGNPIGGIVDWAVNFSADEQTYSGWCQTPLDVHHLYILLGLNGEFPVGARLYVKDVIVAPVPNDSTIVPFFYGGMAPDEYTYSYEGAVRRSPSVRRSASVKHVDGGSLTDNGLLVADGETATIAISEPSTFMVQAVYPNQEIDGVPVEGTLARIQTSTDVVLGAGLWDRAGIFEPDYVGDLFTGSDLDETGFVYSFVGAVNDSASTQSVATVPGFSNGYSSTEWAFEASRSLRLLTAETVTITEPSTILARARNAGQQITTDEETGVAEQDNGFIRVNANTEFTLSDGWWDLLTIIDGHDFPGLPFSGDSGILTAEGWQAVTRWETIGAELLAVAGAMQPIVNYTIQRSMDGETWELFTGFLDEPTTLNDHSARSNGDTYYRITTYSDTGSSTTNETVVHADSPDIFINAGNDLTEWFRLSYNHAHPGINAGRAREAIHYAGREKPVAYAGEALEKVVNFSGALPPEQSVEHLLEVVTAREAILQYRDPDGRRVQGIIPSLDTSRDTVGWWTISGEIREAD